MAKRKRRKIGWERRIHYTAKESLHGRIRKKLLGKMMWYKNKKKNGDGVTTGNGRGQKRKQGEEDGSKLKTGAVLFLEQTPHGELARRVRELMTRLEPVVGFRLRVAARTGRNILSYFPQNMKG